MIKSLLIRYGYTNEQIEPLQQIKRNFWNINWLKTIYFNFRVLPFNQAVFLPFVLSYHVKIRSYGNINLQTKPSPGIFSLGVIKVNYWESYSEDTIFSNQGTVYLKGRIKIHPGAKIAICKDAILNLGERVSIGARTKLICAQSIKIGNDFQISWDGQIFDTDFHFLKKIVSGKVYPRKKPVIIGDNVFIGNSSTIGKGTVLPKGTVVSCCSKVGGDYSDEGDNLLIAGNPAKIVNKGFEMGNGWFPNIERELSIQME